MSLELAPYLRLPEKHMQLLPIFFSRDGVTDWKYVILQGGRASGKTQSMARIVLGMCESWYPYGTVDGEGRMVRPLRIVCARDSEIRLEESVYTTICDLVEEYQLPFEVRADRLEHLVTGCRIEFRGLKSSVRGVEGVDLFWIDEAHQISDSVLRELDPTIRKENCKIVFTMNRLRRNDPVIVRFADREDCFNIQLNYTDNEFCPAHIIKVAEDVKRTNRAEYENDWLGEPLDDGEIYLFDYDRMMGLIGGEVYEGIGSPSLVMSVDVSAGGDDSVATFLESWDLYEWRVKRREAWRSKDTMATIGNITSLVGRYNPDVLIVDNGGMGHVIIDHLVSAGLDCVRFDGNSGQHVNVKDYLNARAEAYYLTREWMDAGRLAFMDSKGEALAYIKELDATTVKRPYGRKQLSPKEDIKKTIGRSPDNADSLAMAVWGASKFLGRKKVMNGGSIVRIDSSKRKSLRSMRHG